MKAFNFEFLRSEEVGIHFFVLHFELAFAHCHLQGYAQQVVTSLGNFIEIITKLLKICNGWMGDG